MGCVNLCVSYCCKGLLDLLLSWNRRTMKRPLFGRNRIIDAANMPKIIARRKWKKFEKQNSVKLFFEFEAVLSDHTATIKEPGYKHPRPSPQRLDKGQVFVVRVIENQRRLLHYWRMGTWWLWSAREVKAIEKWRQIGDDGVNNGVSVMTD